MKHCWIRWWGVWALACASASAEPGELPRPARVHEEAGALVLRAGQVAVDAPAGWDVAVLAEAAGFPLGTGDLPVKIRLRADRTAGTGAEGYRLRIRSGGIEITAAEAAGLRYGMQSLAQMMGGHRAGAEISLPVLEIEDTPRFGWRGYMLDESRHFTGVRGMKRLLDAMGRYKLNRLHWHLTDSAGWRIEIAGYPQLTAVGAKGDETDRRADAPARFYTRAEVAELRAYARARGILIVPEIDMPGHADAAVRAYPEHDGGGFLQKGSSEKWPHFTFNPARPATLEFLDRVLRDVAAQFPDAGVIHLGGDEVNFGWGKWTSLPDVRSLMEREHLAGAAEVEGWFNRRMAGTVHGLGFRTGGWDEMAGRGLDPASTLVFWWRHDKPDVLRQALDKGYSVVLCPRRPCYFDFVQDAAHHTGRRWGGFNPWEDVYAFPDSLKLPAAAWERVAGVQACLWTETTITQARRDFLTWPRLCALAEAAWTPAERKDAASFRERLRPEIGWLRSHGIAPYDPFGPSPEVTDQGAKPEYLDRAE